MKKTVGKFRGKELAGQIRRMERRSFGEAEAVGWKKSRPNAFTLTTTTITLQAAKKSQPASNR